MVRVSFWFVLSVSSLLFIWFLLFVWFLWFDAQNKQDEPDQPNKPERPDKLSPSLSAPETRKTPSALFIHLIVGQTTQNPELITQNFSKRAGCFLMGKEVFCAPNADDLPR